MDEQDAQDRPWGFQSGRRVVWLNAFALSTMWNPFGVHGASGASRSPGWRPGTISNYDGVEQVRARLAKLGLVALMVMFHLGCHAEDSGSATPVPSGATIAIRAKYGPVKTGDPTFHVNDTVTVQLIADRLREDPERARPRKALWSAIGAITLHYEDGEKVRYLIGPASFAKDDGDLEYSFGDDFHPWLIGLLEKLQAEE